MPRTACRNSGLAGSFSILRRSRLICTSTARSLTVPPPVEAPEQVAFGPYLFHLDRGELRQGEDVIHLTDREREMLRILGLARGETVPRSALTAGDGTVNERAVDVQINRLRRKIERDPANPLFLQAVRGIGYRLVASP